MISKNNQQEIFVWIWLHLAIEPIVAGKLIRKDGFIWFIYGQSYLENKNSIPIYDKELPLERGLQRKGWKSEEIPSCLRDASPDAWGRRVILHKILGTKGNSIDTGDIDEFTYLLESGSDRIGALDFQKSGKIYEPRLGDITSLIDLQNFTEAVEQGIAIPNCLLQAINHGTSIGGARPKALLDGEDKKYIAKFSSSTDPYNVIKAEFIAMRLASMCNLQVAKVNLARVVNKDVLLIERFDRQKVSRGWQRKLMLSALTLLGLDEMTPHYASYSDLATIILDRFSEPHATQRELFGRIVFNILCGNTDDHARNHAATSDGYKLTLTPAYDICPQLRYGGEATQAMIISGSDRTSRLITCLRAAGNFGLSSHEAKNIIDFQIATIEDNWQAICDEAELTDIEVKLFRERMFLHSYAFEGYKS